MQVVNRKAERGSAATFQRCAQPNSPCCLPNEKIRFQIRRGFGGFRRIKILPHQPSLPADRERAARRHFSRCLLRPPLAHKTGVTPIRRATRSSQITRSSSPKTMARFSKAYLWPSIQAVHEPPAFALIFHRRLSGSECIESILHGFGHRRACNGRDEKPFCGTRAGGVFRFPSARRAPKIFNLRKSSRARDAGEISARTRAAPWTA